MRVRITLPVKSINIIGNTIAMHESANSFYLNTNTEGVLVSISLETAAMSQDDHPKITQRNGVTNIDFTSATVAILLDRARTVEGLLANYGVHEFNFSDVTFEWLPENDHEKNLLQAPSFRYSSEPANPVPTSREAISLMLQGLVSCDRAQDSQIFLSFFKNGNLAFFRQRYIEAIYDYYFMIESEFGNGKFKERDILKEFAKSAALREATEKTKNLSKDLIFEAREAELIKAKYSPKSFDECWKEVVLLRGTLHHHSKTHPNKWNPRIPAPFQVDAAFLHHICAQLASSMFCKYALSEETLAAFKKAKIQRLVKDKPKPSSN